MATAIVYILNKDNYIIHQFKCDWNEAINTYHGKKDSRGRYYIGAEGKSVPFELLPKKTFEITGQIRDKLDPDIEREPEKNP